MKKKIISTIFMSLFILFNVTTIFAETKANSSIQLDKEVTGYITNSNKQDLYTLNLSKSGRVKFNYNSYIYDSYIQILDNSGRSISNTEVYYGYADSPKYKTISLDLDAGTYQIKIYPYSSNTGKYTLKITNTPANNNDQEPNNGTVTAQPLELNTTTTGFISATDKQDYYKVNISKAGRVTFNYNSYIYDSYIQILDANGNSLYNTEVYYGYLDEPKQTSIRLDLEAGKYYIKVYPYSSNTGKYTLKVTNTPANNIDVEPNNGTVTAQPLNLNTTTTGFISKTDSYDYYKINVSKKGNLNIQYNSYIYDSYIQVLDSNGNSVYKTEVYYGYLDNPKYKEINIDVNQGTYYIKIYPYSSNTGKYTLKARDDSSKSTSKKSLTTDIYKYDAGSSKKLTYINGSGYSQYVYLNKSGNYAFTPSSWMTAAGLTVTMPTSSNGYLMTIDNNYIKMYNNAVTLLNNLKNNKIAKSDIQKSLDEIENIGTNSTYTVTAKAAPKKSLTKDIYKYDAGKGKYLTYINGKGYSQYSYLNKSGNYAFTPSSWMKAAGLTVTMPTSSNGYTMKITNQYKLDYEKIVKEIESYM